eukprot:3501863-Rhodomonas_salina.1
MQRTSSLVCKRAYTLPSCPNPVSHDFASLQLLCTDEDHLQFAVSLLSPGAHKEGRIKLATTGLTRGTACLSVWRLQHQQRPAALQHPSYDDGTTRLPQ